MIASIYDDFSLIQDNQVNMTNKDEMLLVNKAWGSHIRFLTDDMIIIKTKSGSKIKLNETTGEFKVFDKNNYGFQCDGNGNINIYGNVTFNGTVTGLTSATGGTVTGTNPKNPGTF